MDDQEQYEVEDRLSHRKEGTKTEYLVRFKGYSPKDDLWLPQRNLDHAQDLIKEYHDRQRDMPQRMPLALNEPDNISPS